MKKILFLSAMCLLSLSVSAQMSQFVDLGLPSGTLWKSTNESGFYTYDEALKSFGNSLPTKAQLDELRDYCEWIWEGRGFKVVGPNGSFVFLPAAGGRNFDGNVDGVGSGGYYWSSTPNGADNAWYLFFHHGELDTSHDNRCYGLSVRIVLCCL